MSDPSNEPPDPLLELICDVTEERLRAEERIATIRWAAIWELCHRRNLSPPAAARMILAAMKARGFTDGQLKGQGLGEDRIKQIKTSPKPDGVSPVEVTS